MGYCEFLSIDSEPFVHLTFISGKEEKFQISIEKTASIIKLTEKRICLRHTKSTIFTLGTPVLYALKLGYSVVIDEQEYLIRDMTIDIWVHNEVNCIALKWQCSREKYKTVKDFKNDLANDPLMTQNKSVLSSNNPSDIAHKFQFKFKPDWILLTNGNLSRRSLKSRQRESTSEEKGYENLLVSGESVRDYNNPIILDELSFSHFVEQLESQWSNNDVYISFEKRRIELPSQSKNKGLAALPVEIAMRVCYNCSKDCRSMVMLSHVDRYHYHLVSQDIFWELLYEIQFSELPKAEASLKQSWLRWNSVIKNDKDHLKEISYKDVTLDQFYSVFSDEFSIPLEQASSCVGSNRMLSEVRSYSFSQLSLQSAVFFDELCGILQRRQSVTDSSFSGMRNDFHRIRIMDRVLVYTFTNGESRHRISCLYRPIVLKILGFSVCLDDYEQNDMMANSLEFRMTEKEHLFQGDNNLIWGPFVYTFLKSWTPIQKLEQDIRGSYNYNETIKCALFKYCRSRNVEYSDYVETLEKLRNQEYKSMEQSFHYALYLYTNYSRHDWDSYGFFETRHSSDDRQTFVQEMSTKIFDFLNQLKLQGMLTTELKKLEKFFYDDDIFVISDLFVDPLIKSLLLEKSRINENLVKDIRMIYEFLKFSFGTAIKKNIEKIDDLYTLNIKVDHSNEPISDISNYQLVQANIDEKQPLWHFCGKILRSHDPTEYVLLVAHQIGIYSLVNSKISKQQLFGLGEEEKLWLKNVSDSQIHYCTTQDGQEKILVSHCLDSILSPVLILPFGKTVGYIQYQLRTIIGIADAEFKVLDCNKACDDMVPLYTVLQKGQSRLQISAGDESWFIPMSTGDSTLDWCYKPSVRITSCQSPKNYNHHKIVLDLYTFPPTKETLKKLLENSLKNESIEKVSLSSADFFNLMKICQALVSQEENVVSITSDRFPITIIGDLRGSLQDLWTIFSIDRIPGVSGKQFVFLGDISDSSVSGNALDIVIVVLLLKMQYPENVVLLAGNRDTFGLMSRFGIKRQLQDTYPKEWQKLFVKLTLFFRQLPLAAVINENLFASNGGLPSVKGTTIDQINNINRSSRMSSDFDEMRMLLTGEKWDYIERLYIPPQTPHIMTVEEFTTFVEDMKRNSEPIGMYHIVKGLLDDHPVTFESRHEQGEYHFTDRTFDFLKTNENIEFTVSSYAAGTEGYLLNHGGRSLTICSTTAIKEKNSDCNAAFLRSHSSSQSIEICQFSNSDTKVSSSPQYSTDATCNIM